MWNVAPKANSSHVNLPIKSQRMVAHNGANVWHIIVVVVVVVVFQFVAMHASHQTVEANNSNSS